MAKKRYKQTGKEEEVVAEKIEGKPPADTNHWLSNKWLPFAILFLFGTLLYINTINNEYAVDDTLVVSQNKFTQKGFAGLKEIFTTDAFEGFIPPFFKYFTFPTINNMRYLPICIAFFLRLDY